MRAGCDAPRFPDAAVVGISSSRERDPETGSLDDHYTTVRTETLAMGVRLRRAEASYPHHLTRHGWRVRTFWEERVAGNPPPGVQTIGRRGKALVVVAITPTVAGAEVDVTGDYLGNRLCRSRIQSGCW